MNPREEELQRDIENGQMPAEGLDAKAYQHVFRALRKDPAYELPSDFAHHVLSLVAKHRQSDASKDYFWFFAGIFFLAIAFLATVLFTGFRFNFGFLNAMSQYSGLALFGIVFIGFLNWLDKRLVRERHIQHRT
jgi:hypothetical protein